MNFRSWMVLAVLGGVGMAHAGGDRWDIKTTKLVAPSYYINFFGGQSLLIIGSEDRRVGIGIGLGYGRPEPRFTFQKVPAQLVYEVYYDHTSSRGASGQGPNQVESVGALAYARYMWAKKRGMGFYATVGWGLQYSNQTTVDLGSKINSTPTVGFGVTWDTGEGEGSIGIRLLHISNGGLVPPNQGQNQLFLVYSWRF
jgi:hypothetical protein